MHLFSISNFTMKTPKFRMSMLCIEEIKENRLNVKQHQESKCDEDKYEFREANRRAKREVAKSKVSAYK